MAAWLRNYWLLFFHFTFFATFAVIGTTVIEAASTPGLESLASLRRPTTSALQRYLSPLDGFVRSTIAQPYERFWRGSLRVWDMVGLLAACSLVQAYRLWRQRSSKRGDPYADEDGNFDKQRSSFDDPERANKFGTPHHGGSILWFPYSSTASRSCCHRSRPPTQTLDFELIYNLLCNLSIDTCLLPAPSSG